MNSVTRDWSRGNAASENKARLSFREAQTLRAKLVSTMKQRRTHERIDEKTQHSAWLGVSEPGFWGGPETAARLRLGFGEERRGWAIPRRSSFSIVTSLHLPFFCHVQTRRRANCQDTLPWSSVLAGCGGCTSALLPSPSPCMDSLGSNKPTLQQEEWRSDREKRFPVYEEGLAVWEQKLGDQPFPPMVSMAPPLGS